MITRSMSRILALVAVALQVHSTLAFSEISSEDTHETVNITVSDLSLEDTNVTVNATLALPTALMHYMPWFKFSRKWSRASQHWKEKMNWKKDLLGKHRVASHYTPLIGPYNSNDRKVIRYHLALMKAAGVKGVIVNWYGTRKKWDFVKPNLAGEDAIIDEASKMGMLFSVCYEDWTTVAGKGLGWGKEPSGKLLGDALAQEKKDFEYIRDKYATKPGFLKEGNGGTTGRPVIFTFGPRTMRKKKWWTSELEAVFPSEATRPKVVSMYYGGPAVGDGKFNWFPSMKTPQKVKAMGQATVLNKAKHYLERFYQKNKGTLHVGAVWPGFHDYYKQGRNTKSYGYLPTYGGATFDMACDVARQYQPTFVQVATWNDWEEGTMFEPALGRKEKGSYFYLLKLQQQLLGKQQESDFTSIYDNFVKLKDANAGWTTKADIQAAANAPKTRRRRRRRRRRGPPRACRRRRYCPAKKAKLIEEKVQLEGNQTKARKSRPNGALKSRGKGKSKVHM